MIRMSYKYMDGDILKHLFIALVRTHQELGKAILSLKLIKGRKLFERVQKWNVKLKNIPYEGKKGRIKLSHPYYCWEHWK